MARGIPRSRNTAMNGAHSPIVSSGTASWSLPNSACFTQIDLAHPPENAGKLLVEKPPMPAITDSGSARSGKVIESVRWTESGFSITAFMALTKSFFSVGATGVPIQSR